MYLRYIISYNYALTFATTHDNSTIPFTTVSINQHQTPSSSDDMTDYIITFAHQYEYNSREFIATRYSSFIPIIKMELWLTIQLYIHKLPKYTDRTALKWA